MLMIALMCRLRCFRQVPTYFMYRQTLRSTLDFSVASSWDNSSV